MPTPTKNEAAGRPRRSQRAEPVSRSFGVALALHAAVLGSIFGFAAFERERHPRWGDQDPVAGSIQASMVSALPLPPREKPVLDKVLAVEKTSPAPDVPPPAPAPLPKAKAEPVKPKAEPPPKPEEVKIPDKAPPKPAPTKADAPAPEPPKRAPAPPPPPTPKATTGEAAGVQIPQSVTQMKNGTSAITVEERSFGDRNAYYIRLISQKVNENWVQEAEARSSNGKRATVTFTIDRDGTPTDAHVSVKSGSPSLDAAALRTIQRIDTFGPLPQGDHITIDFSFDFRIP